MVTSNLVGRRSYYTSGPDEYLWYHHILHLYFYSIYYLIL
jgi:hypothetical protein